jgi:hypothetical protein
MVLHSFRKREKNHFFLIRCHQGSVLSGIVWVSQLIPTLFPSSSTYRQQKPSSVSMRKVSIKLRTYDFVPTIYKGQNPDSELHCGCLVWNASGATRLWSRLKYWVRRVDSKSFNGSWSYWWIGVHLWALYYFFNDKLGFGSNEHPDSMRNPTIIQWERYVLFHFGDLSSS